METIKLQAIIQKTDIPYVKEFLKEIAQDISFEEDDFADELSEEDLQSIAISREQIRNGLFVTNEEVFEQSRKRRNEKWKK